MIDFAAARRMMVDGQVRTADVTDPRLIAAMLELPREQFVPEDKTSFAYLDFDMPMEGSAGRAPRRLLKPMVLAKLLQAADIGPNDHVLDVGCASGYSTAILSRLAGSVIGLDEDEMLVRQGREALSTAAVKNAKIVTGPLAAGWAPGAPYDLIVLEGATEVIPSALLSQLKNGGRMVCVMGRGPSGKAMFYRQIDDDFSGRPVFDAAAPVLPGFSQPPAFVF